MKQHNSYVKSTTDYLKKYSKFLNESVLITPVKSWTDQQTNNPLYGDSVNSPPAPPPSGGNNSSGGGGGPILSPGDGNSEEENSEAGFGFFNNLFRRLKINLDQSARSYPNVKKLLNSTMDRIERLPKNSVIVKHIMTIADIPRLPVGWSGPVYIKPGAPYGPWFYAQHNDQWFVFESLQYEMPSGQGIGVWIPMTHSPPNVVPHPFSGQQ
jgi:hypothetical protein